MIGQLVDNFYLSDEQFKELPSLKDGLDLETETKQRLYGCDLICEAGILLKLGQAVLATAQVLFHRFYCKKSFVKFPVKKIASTCVWLASKLEETPRRIREVVNVFLRMECRREGLPLEPLDYMSERYKQLRDRMIRHERQILREFGFIVHVEHPHKFVLNYLQMMDQTNELMQEAWSLVNDSLRTTLCVRFNAEVVACGVIFLAARRQAVPLPEDPPWWDLFNVERSAIDEVCRMLCGLYTMPKPQYEHVVAPEIPLTSCSFAHHEKPKEPKEEPKPPPPEPAASDAQDKAGGAEAATGGAEAAAGDRDARGAGEKGDAMEVDGEKPADVAGAETPQGAGDGASAGAGAGDAAEREGGGAEGAKGGGASERSTKSGATPTAGGDKDGRDRRDRDDDGRYEKEDRGYDKSARRSERRGRDRSRSPPRRDRDSNRTPTDSYRPRKDHKDKYKSDYKGDYKGGKDYKEDHRGESDYSASPPPRREHSRSPPPPPPRRQVAADDRGRGKPKQDRPYADDRSRSYGDHRSSKHGSSRWKDGGGYRDDGRKDRYDDRGRYGDRY